MAMTRRLLLLMLAVTTKCVASQVTNETAIMLNASLAFLQGNEVAFPSFVPYTTVADQAAIDLDQKVIETHLDLGTDEGLISALTTYVGGAFSGSYAELKLTTPIKVDLRDGARVEGTSSSGDPVTGYSIGSFNAGERLILVQYEASPALQNATRCHVGGNPDPFLDGCFAASGKIFLEKVGSYEYSYSPRTKNFNVRTLQGFSLQAKEKFVDCVNCPYKTYSKYLYYYGFYDYADQWILSAFGRNPTNFHRGNADFSLYRSDGANEAIKRGTVLLSTWTWVIGQLEDAVGDCLAGCGTDQCNEGRYNSWEAAAAFYVGWIANATAGAEGYLLYTEAQRQCQPFGTCMEDSGGLARVNHDAIEEFRAGQQDVLAGNCSSLTQRVDRITELMTVPLVQGTLYYAYTIDQQNDVSERAESSGAVFAAAVLPLVQFCSEPDADIIYDNMRVGNGGIVDFGAVKEALERTYDCLGIDCSLVGGLVDPNATDEYLPWAEPCSLDAIEAEDFVTSRTPGKQ